MSIINNQPPALFPAKVSNNVAEPATVEGYWSEDQVEGPMTVFDLVMGYHLDAGVVLLPVCGSPTKAQVGGQAAGAQPVKAEIAQLHAPWMQVTARFRARRHGLPVPVPDWRPPDSSQYVLKAADFLAKDPTLDTDGLTYIFSAEGFFTYYLRVPLTIDDGFPRAVAPYQKLPTVAVGITPDQFRQMLFPL